MIMNSPTQRIREIEARLRDRTPEVPPTASFFATDRFQAAAGYGGKSAADILDDVEHVNAAIAEYDAIRRQHRLDLVDFAILVSRTWYRDHAQTPGAIDGLICQAMWSWNRDRHGEDRAWRSLNMRQSFEHVIDGRLRQAA